MQWMKLTQLTATGSPSEMWLRRDKGETVEFPLDLYLGKKTDLLALKKNIVESIRNQIEFYRDTRRKLYISTELEDVPVCPVCSTAVNSAILKVDIYGAEYVQCAGCTHVYVKRRPTHKTIADFYLNDVTYAATYTDKASAETRMNAVAVPWVHWMQEVYQKSYGRLPQRVLDVGSGAGHFVEACRRAGLQAAGVELSTSSRDFARNIWELELDGRDFLKVGKEYEGYDVVTFWGLLEHTPNPGALLECANQIVHSSPTGGMVIAKIPRWESLSSAIQVLCHDTVLRHLDPMGHIMAFTDASAAELYYQQQLRPVAAWYYGMDIYETLMQIGNVVGSYDHFTQTGSLQRELQQFIDEMRCSDGLVLAGKP